MNICIFADNIKDSNKSGWISFISYFLKKNYNIYFLTETSSSKKTIQSINNEINVYSINENIDLSIIHSTDLVNLYSNKYLKSNLFKERLSIKSSPNSAFYKDPMNFENILISHLVFIERFLESNQINF